MLLTASYDGRLSYARLGFRNRGVDHWMERFKTRPKRPPALAASHTCSHRRPEISGDRTGRTETESAKNPRQTGLHGSWRDQAGPRFTGSNPVGATKRTA